MYICGHTCWGEARASTDWISREGGVPTPLKVTLPGAFSSVTDLYVATVAIASYALQIYSWQLACGSVVVHYAHVGAYNCKVFVCTHTCMFAPAVSVHAQHATCSKVTIHG